MADVYIAYTPSDEPHAKALAADFQDQALSAWYRGNHLSCTHSEADEALHSSPALVVIWSTFSAENIYVCAEAMTAFRENKLVSTRLPEMDVAELLPPYDQLETLLITDRAAIYRAVHRLVGLRSA
jgi:hypothetical protein